MLLQVDVGRLGGSALVREYLAASSRATPFYADDPFAVAAYRHKLAEAQRRFSRGAREQAAAAVQPTSPRVAERLRRFVDEGGAMITTGQQAGLFGGPLYTVYKILTAIGLAEQLERTLGVVVLPVFWIASEDHDWEEVNHTWIVDGKNRLRRLQADSPETLPLPMSERTIGSGIETTLHELAHVVAGQPFADRWLPLLRDAYRPRATVAGAFRQWIANLFQGFDLLITDAADPVLKTMSIPVLQAAVADAAGHARAVSEQTEALQARGFAAQVPVLPGAANLFWHGPAGRERLQFGGGTWRAPAARATFTAAELKQRIAIDPQQFSPNVFLRPVVESAVFPTLAYVGGPGEIAYFAQISGLFREYGMEMPLVFPRFSALLIPADVQRMLDRLSLGVSDARVPLYELLSRAARTATPPELEQALADLRRATVAGFRAVIDSLPAADSPLALAVGAERNRALLRVAAGEQKILAHRKRTDEPLRSAALAVHNSLYPHGVPQERMLNPLPFLARNGELLERLASAVTLPASLRDARGTGGTER